jgi:hypothetical protein
MEGKPPATIECRSAGPDLPQALIAGREDTWLRHFFSGWRHDPMTISGEAFETYVNATANLVPYGARSPTIAPAQKTSRKISENPLPCPLALVSRLRGRLPSVRHGRDLERDGGKSLGSSNRTLW